MSQRRANRRFELPDQAGWSLGGRDRLSSGAEGLQTKLIPRRKQSTAISRLAKFCWYSKPRSTVNSTSKFAASASFRSSPFSSPANPAYRAVCDTRVLADGGAVARLHTHQAKPAFRPWPIRAVVLLRARRLPSRAKRWDIRLETLRACALVPTSRTRAEAARVCPERQAFHQESWDSCTMTLSIRIPGALLKEYITALIRRSGLARDWWAPDSKACIDLLGSFVLPGASSSVSVRAEPRAFRAQRGQPTSAGWDDCRNSAADNRGWCRASS